MQTSEDITDILQLHRSTAAASSVQRFECNENLLNIQVNFSHICVCVCTVVWLCSPKYWSAELWCSITLTAVTTDHFGPWFNFGCFAKLGVVSLGRWFRLRSNVTFSLFSASSDYLHIHTYVYNCYRQWEYTYRYMLVCVCMKVFCEIWIAKIFYASKNCRHH